ncbi:MAG TPA: glycosyltransferase [Planctomycetota bacterium]
MNDPAGSGARVLHVFATFAPGGPQVRATRLLPELPRDWRHAIVALDGNTAARTLLAQELGVELLPAPPRAGTLRTTRALARLLVTWRPDLLLTYNFGALDALLAARLTGLRAVVHHEDGFLPDEVAGFKRRRVWARRLVLPGTHAVIVPSHRLEEIARTLWHLAPPHLLRIPNGLAPGDFPERDGNPRRRAELGIGAEELVVGSVGHLRPEKNPVRLVEAMGAVAGHLLMLGDGPERPRVEAAARAAGLGSRLHLVGHRVAPQADYQAMDVFALSSDTEQMPVALLEAMASALPVVATDVGDVRRILPEEQGELVVPAAAGPAGLARALQRLLADPALRARLGRANRARVEREFSFERMVSAYRSVYGRALG